MSILSEVIDQYNSYGCRSKVDSNRLIEEVDKEIAVKLDEMNNISSKYIDIKYDLSNYKKVRLNLIPKRLRKDINGYMMSIRRLIIIRKKCINDTLMDLEVDKYDGGMHALNCNFLNNKCRSVYLANCKEDMSSLFTFSFINFQFHYLYRNTKLSKFFGKDFKRNVSNYLLRNGIEVDNKSLILYLLLRSADENYRNRDMYLDNKEMLDKIDSILYDLTEGVCYSTMKSPRAKVTEFIVSLFSCVNLNDVVLYYFDYDTITLKINDKVNLDKFIETFNSVLSSSSINFIPCRYIIGKSLLHNLDMLASDGVLINGDVIDSSVEDSKSFK